MNIAPRGRLDDALARHWIALTLVTWIGTAHFGLPAWAPLLPAVALATIVTFILNRWLVFA